MPEVKAFAVGIELMRIDKCLNAVRPHKITLV